jgi:hypothetical protein
MIDTHEIESRKSQNGYFSFKLLVFFLALATLQTDGCARTKSVPELKSMNLKIEQPKFPKTETHDLNGRALTLPDDLPANKTILLVAFEREQQADIDSWVSGLDLRVDGTGMAWLEIPVVGKMPWIGRAFINNGMRGGIPDKAKRAHVTTLYVNQEKWLKSLGLAGTHQVCVLVIDRAGNVLARQDGPFEKNNSQAILAAMGIESTH